MKAIFHVLIVFTIVFLSNNLLAQQIEVKRSNNKVNLYGKPYYIHIVRKGETLYRISMAYQVPTDTIKKDNLNITDSLKINQYIKIRVAVDETENQQKFLSHQVQKGDTPFNIAIKYNITIDDLYAHNPEAKMGITIGQILKIPVTESKPDLKPQPEQQSQTLQPTNNYVIHIVQKKETLYGIAAKYGTTQDKIIELNPELKEKAIQVNQELKIEIPANDITETTVYYQHKVKKQETLYGISRHYNLTEKDILKANPTIENRPIKEGELLNIPKNNTLNANLSTTAKKDTQKIEPKRDKYTFWKDTLLLAPCPVKEIDKKTKYKVALFLPFNLNINDTLGKYLDILVKDSKGVETIETVTRTGPIVDKIYSKSVIFIEFYQGALIALNDMKKMGISFDIHVYDTQDSLYVEQLFKTNDFSKFDLFIGPVYGADLETVGNYAKTHSINIVSPLSLKNDFIESNPFAFQVSPPFEVQMQHASDFLNNFDVKNYIVIHDGNNLDQEYISQFKKQLFSQMNDQNFNKIKYNEVFYYDARDSVLKGVFTSGMKNIVIVPSSDQAFVTDVMGKLNGYSYEYDITVFGQPRWLRFENIELDNFHNTNTHIFSNSFIDYSDNTVIDFVKQYRSNFKSEPDNYAFKGYDIVKYFCLALNIYGKDFRKCIHNYQPEMLQTDFHFVPYANNGGYQNTAIYILEYGKDYKLSKVAHFPK